ncbi:MAG TPA: phenylalanine--tRNA ligase subunit beta [Candidatus Saccharimonadales bacterium]|nr:phenylalanine--tRNA ligase subunit beta [Candidatus Saccharimonadales bacterium]
MKVSLGHIRYYQQKYHWAGDPAPDDVDALVRRIGEQLGAVEEVTLFGKRFEGVVIVKIVSRADHPNSDHLHICKIDDGGYAKDVTRDENGHVQVVCGAPNVREGLTVAWLPPGNTVPETYDKKPFVLEARQFRGELSNGMLASSRELSLGDNHDGILEIDEDITPGTLFMDAYHLRDDVVIDLENKMFTHRPDCFGMLGVAREIAGIQQQQFTSPEWYRVDATIPSADGALRVAVRNEVPELVPRFVAVPMSGIVIKPSPVWLQVNLARLGVRPINNVVDLTNYFMLLTGQPLHAYDYDKVKARSKGDQATIVVRYPRDGEKILLLNGKEIVPRAEAIIIATDQELIGIGGIMGGGETEVDEHTTNIILECANFDMYSIRRTSMTHGLFTDAVTRFTKGQSPLQNLAVLGKIVQDVSELAGGVVAGPLVDDNHLPEDVRSRGSIHPPVTVSRQFVNVRLGLDLPAAEMQKLLRNVECKVTLTGDELTVTAPFWRTDIEIPEDIVEEVGRLYGYDKLPVELPRRDLTPAEKNPLRELKNRLRNHLASRGANEILSYSFVHGNLLEKVGQASDQAFRLSNALSPDLQYFRLSLTPSLLDKIHPNIKAGYDEFALFEIGKAHQQDITTEDDLPKELERVALVFAADTKVDGQYAGAPYYQAKHYVEGLLHALGIAQCVVYEPLDPAESDQSTPYYAAGRAATVKVDGNIVGRVGEYSVLVRKSLKLPDFCAGFELGIEPLAALAANREYRALPRFPAVTQDLCLKVPAATTYAEVYTFTESQLHDHRPDQTHHTLTPIDNYQRQDDTAHKQITLRLSIASFERTLTDAEVAALLDHVADAAAGSLHAERI